MTNKYTTTKECNVDDHCCSVNCLSWGAIFSGALVAVGLSFLLNLFGVAIGLSIYSASKSGIQTLAIGEFFGMTIGIMVVMFFSGWISGYLGRAHCIKRHFGTLYGLTTWCLALMFSAVLVTHFGDFVNKQHHAIINANETILKMTPNTTAFKSAVETTTHTNTKTDTIQVSNHQENEQAANTFGKSLLLTFLLFFVGALMCTYGGYVGMKK
jgi:hypothetical protein